MLLPRQRLKLARGANDEEHTMFQNLNTSVAVIGIDIGKNSFHIVLDSHDGRELSMPSTISSAVNEKNAAKELRSVKIAVV